MVCGLQSNRSQQAEDFGVPSTKVFLQPVIGNSVCVSVCSLMDLKYVIPLEPSGFHGDAHVGHLGFLRRWQKTVFVSAVSQHPDQLCG